MITVDLFVDEINFLEETAKHVLTDDFKGWWISHRGFGELDMSKATESQKMILVRRLGGYDPEIIDEVLRENRVPQEFRGVITRSIIGRSSRAGFIKFDDE